jgi:hypothetical protein
VSTPGGVQHFLRNFFTVLVFVGGVGGAITESCVYRSGDCAIRFVIRNFFLFLRVLEQTDFNTVWIISCRWDTVRSGAYWKGAAIDGKLSGVARPEGIELLEATSALPATLSVVF